MVVFVNYNEYLNLLNNARESYKTFSPLCTPALNKEKVYFSSLGFNHIIYKNKNKRRFRQDQYMRLKMLNIARKIIEISTTFQEYDEIKQLVLSKVRHKKVQVEKTVKYWGFVAILEGYRAKVIVRKIGNGNIHFWSVIPVWRKRKLGTKFVRSFTNGNLRYE